MRPHNRSIGLHWLATIYFIVLAPSGLNFTFGKQVILPLVGPEAFATISRLGKYAHNYLSFPFTISVVLIFLIWISAIPSFFEIKESGGVRALSEKNLIVIF
jgi:formate dehydrogenase subunit gamma